MIISTTDGHKISLTAHVRNRRQLGEAATVGAGVGLLELAPPEDFPAPGSEEEQIEIFLEARRVSAGRPVTVLLPGPAPGWPEGGRCAPEVKTVAFREGIRSFLVRPEFYRPWLRALLRAGAEGLYELALPMVSHVSEIIELKKYLSEIRTELEKDGVPHQPPAVGIMVDAPSVLPAIDAIIFEAGFFIVGKRFLGCLMADSGLPRDENDFVSFYHQAFLLQVESLIDSLRRRKSRTRFCGPLVKDPVAIPLLVGFGFGEIIAPSEYIPGIKKIVQSINYLDARMVASKTTSYWEPGKAREYARERFPKLTR